MESSCSSSCHACFGGSRCVRRGRNFLFPAWNNCFQIYGEGCKGGLPYPGNSGNTAGNPGRSGIACGKRRNGKNRKKRGYKDIITKKTLYALAKKNGCTVSDQEYDDYAKLLKTQMNKAENRKEIRDFYAGFGGESAYWKNMEPVIRQNLAVRKYIDSQTGTQTEEEIKQEAYESGAKQTDLDAFEQVVEDVCEEIGDYLKTLQKSDASVYYFASSDKERVTESGG